MQCRACGFENMPGSGYCARCRASLQLATALVDVHPPRARFGATVQNWFLPVRRLWYSAQSVLRSRIPTRLVPTAALPGSAWWRLFLPGWPQLARGNARVGWPLFVGSLLALVGGTVLFGTYVGAMLWGMAFAAHVASIQDGFFTGWQSVIQRLSFGAAIAVLLFTLIYRPAFRQWNRHVAAVQVVETLGDFRPGDVIWYQPRAEPRVGDWIHFQQSRQHVPVRANYQLVLQGPWFGQVIATSGQSMDWTQELLVDGVPSPHVDPSYPRLALQPSIVPNGYVAVLPESQYSQTAIPASVQSQMVFVAGQRIEGVLLWRIYPIWRLTRF